MQAVSVRIPHDPQLSKKSVGPRTTALPLPTLSLSPLSTADHFTGPCGPGSLSLGQHRLEASLAARRERLSDRFEPPSSEPWPCAAAAALLEPQAFGAPAPWPE